MRAVCKCLVRDKRLRDALPDKTRRTLELLFRELDAGASARDVIGQIASDLKKDERTVRRHLKKAQEICSETSNSSGQILKLLASFVLPYTEPSRPTQATPDRPTVGML